MGRYRESLDTSVLLRLVTGNPPQLYEKAIQLLSRPNIQFDVADLAIVEIVYVLEKAFKFGRTDVTNALNAIVNLPNINCNRELFRLALLAYLTRPKLSFVDCCLTEYTRLNQAESLWTFDKKLATQSDIAKEP
ncbi:MAG: PIN domain-containing protein [Candidatus Nomurabacteria bacterium]|jgi:predicted nucleic-acid-binding protein|nr:PIN domain-containing protein [Candidatus Nomurabacteria bacterium]